MVRLTVLAYAKLNLVLRVIGRREDGYHLLQSLVCAVDLADELELSPWPRGIKLQAPAEVGPVPQNLAHRAARALLRDGEPGVHIVLRKRIPVGAGLGGGSSDAAAVLAGVNELLFLGKTPAELQAVGAALGADVPFFLGPSPAWVEGIGDRVRPVAVSLPGAFLVVVPPFGCPTPEVYRAFDELGAPRSRPQRWEKALGGYAAPGHHQGNPKYENDLWPAAVRLFPKLEAFRELLEEVAPGRVGMTGSGSGLFAAFSSREEASAALERLRLPQGARAVVAAPVGTGYKFLQ